MTLQTKTAAAASITSLFADNSIAGISEEDERTIATNLLDGIWQRVSASIDNTDSPYTVDVDLVQILITDSTSGAITVNLPAVASSANKMLTVKHTGSANNTILDGNASETIDGATTKTLSTQYDVATVYCDGTEWHVIGN